MVLRSELAITDIKSLIESGDLDLAATRAAYKETFGHKTTLSDDDIIACHAAQDDDYGLDDIAHRMAALEAGDEDAAFCEGECVPTPQSASALHAIPAIRDAMLHYDAGLITRDEMLDKIAGALIDRNHPAQQFKP